MKSPPLPIILLNARPAAGKSELIDFLKRVPLAERQNRFHINQFDVFDDFPILWSWFEEDALLENMGHPRLHSDPDEYFTGQHLWHVLIKLLCLEYKNVCVIIQIITRHIHASLNFPEELNMADMQKLTSICVQKSWQKLRFYTSTSRGKNHCEKIEQDLILSSICRR